MARLVFNAGDVFTIGGSNTVTEVFGSSGVDTITIAAGAKATLFGFSSSDAVSLGGNAGSYTAVRSGSSIVLTDAAGGSVTIPVSTTGQSIAFGDATRTLVYNTTSGNVELGGQAITTTAATVTAGTGGSSTAGQTFTLTTGVDTTGTIKGSAGTTSTAGDDKFVASSMDVFNSLDSIDGGAGNDSLALTIAGAVTPLKGTFTGIETVTVTATGSVGAFETLPQQALKQIRTFTVEAASTTASATYASTDKLKVTVGNVTANVDMTGVSTDAGTAAAIAAKIEELLDTAYGTSTGATQWASASSAAVSITAQTAGVALPSISVSGTNASDAALTYKFTSNKTGSGFQANQEASGYIASSVFSVAGVTGVTTFTAEAGGAVNTAAATTTDVTLSSAGRTSLSGGKNVTITSDDYTAVSGAKGAVSVAVGVYATETSTITGGTTVSYSQTGGLTSSGSPIYTASAGVTIGAAPTVATLPTSTVGQTYISNASSSPTGDVTVNISRAYSTLTGQASMIYGTGAVKVYTNGAANVSIKGGATATVTDIQTSATKANAEATAVPGVSKLANVVLDGVSGVSAVTSDALTSLTLVNSGYANRLASTVTVTNNTVGGHALALTVGNNANSVITSGGTTTTTITSVTDATATSVTVGTAAQSISTAANASATNMAINAAAATSFTFNNAHAFTLASSTTTALTTITANGSATLDLGTIGGSNKLTSVNGAAATGSIVAIVDKTIGLGNGGALSAADHSLTVTGGSGADVITVKGAMASATNPATAAIVQNVISLGAGNDVVKNAWDGSSAYTGSIGAGASVSGGDGTDVIAASLLNSGNAAQITGFEVLGLDLRSNSTAYDVRLLSGATGLALLNRTGSYSNVGTTQSLTIMEGATATYSNSVLQLSTDATTLDFGATVLNVGTADAYSVTFDTKAPTSTVASRTDADAGVLNLEGIENLTIVSGGTGFINNHVRLNDASARTLTISGAQNLSVFFGGTSSDDNTTTNYFGTAGTSTDSNGVSLIDASAMTGKLAINTTDIGVAYAGLTVKGGSGDDTVTLAGAATVDLGAGNDTITVASTGGKLTLGAGIDTVNAWAAIAGANKVSTVTITDPVALDRIDFRSSDGSTSATTAALGLAVTGSFNALVDALDAAANATGSLAWLQWGGKTYVVYDADGSTTGGVASTGDVIVTLDGLFDLSKATFNVDTGIVTFG